MIFQFFYVALNGGSKTDGTGPKKGRPRDTRSFSDFVLLVGPGNDCEEKFDGGMCLRLTVGTWHFV